MKEHEATFLSLIALGWFKVDEQGRIWRMARLSGSRTGGPSTVTWLPTPTRAEKSSSADDGYLKVMFRAQGPRLQVYAHRIVWMVANRQQIPDAMEINHKDGNKRNPVPSNLELVTHAQNTLHSFRVLGQQVKEQRGERNTSSKLTEAQVLEIRSLCAGKMPQSQVAARFNVSQRTVSEIHLRKTWAHVP